MPSLPGKELLIVRTRHFRSLNDRFYHECSYFYARCKGIRTRAIISSYTYVWFYRTAYKDHEYTQEVISAKEILDYKCWIFGIYSSMILHFHSVTTSSQTLYFTVVKLC